MAIVTGFGHGPATQSLIKSLCQNDLGAAAEAYANGWRSLTVDRGVIRSPEDFLAVDNLLDGVKQAGRAAGYRGGNGAVLVAWRQWLCWSWCIRDEQVPYVVALARDVADSLNPGTWTVLADLD